MGIWAVFHLFAGWFGIWLVVAAAAFFGWWLLPDLPWVTTKVRQALLMIGIVALTNAFAYAYAYSDGYDYAINQVAKKNERATADVRKQTGKVDECAARGGDWDWDTVRGVCGQR